MKHLAQSRHVNKMWSSLVFIQYKTIVDAPLTFVPDTVIIVYRLQLYSPIFPHKVLHNLLLIQIHKDANRPAMQFQVKWLAQGHLRLWTGGARDRTVISG